MTKFKTVGIKYPRQSYFFGFEWILSIHFSQLFTLIKD